MASGTMTVLDSTGATKTMTTEQDGTNSNALMTKHVLADTAGNPVEVSNDGLHVKVVDGAAGSNKLAVDSSGRVTTLISDGTDTLLISGAGAASTADVNLVAAAALADAAALPTTTKVGAAALLYNGSTLDLGRNVVDVVTLASAARTALVAGSDLSTYGAKAMTVSIDITAYTAGSITVTIEGKDANSIYYTLLSSAALAAAAKTQLFVGLGNTVTTNVSANKPIPKVVRISVAVGDATSITYSIGTCLHY